MDFPALERLERLAANLGEWQRRLAEQITEVTEEGVVGVGDTGLVEVRVDANGRLRDVNIDPRAMRLASADLAAEIKLAAERAYTEMNQRLQDGLREVLGADAPPSESTDSFGWASGGSRW
jgi:DNA-binding protein YbaB